MRGNKKRKSKLMQGKNINMETLFIMKSKRAGIATGPLYLLTH